jgi:anti-sigma factor RsiW
MNNGRTSAGCARAHELAGAWIDGEATSLSGGEERELRLHLAQCAGCREFVAGARAMRGELRSCANAGAVDLWPRIEANLEPRPEHSPARAARRSRVQRWSARIAAALVGGAGVSALLRELEPPSALPDASLTSSLVRIASIVDSPTDLRRIAATPERTLVLALATPRHEERR